MGPRLPLRRRARAMSIRLPERGTPRARRAAAIGLPALLLGGFVYGLVGDAPPLYESEAVLSGASPALLAQYDRLAGGGSRFRHGQGALDRAYLGDPEAIVASARKSLGSREPAGAVRIQVDRGAREIRIVVRDHDRDASRRLANEVTTGVVARRDKLVATQLTNARAELPLVAALALRSPRLRREVAVLRKRIAALKQLRTVQGGGLSVLRLAPTPSKPVAPRVARDVIVAVMLGLLMGFSIHEAKRRSLIRLWVPLASSR